MSRSGASQVSTSPVDRPDIAAASGLSQGALEAVAAAYAKSNATIAAYGMGITQHTLGTASVQQIANLLLLRGSDGGVSASSSPASPSGPEEWALRVLPWLDGARAAVTHLAFAPPGGSDRLGEALVVHGDAQSALAQQDIFQRFNLGARYVADAHTTQRHGAGGGD